MKVYRETEGAHPDRFRVIDDDGKEIGRKLTEPQVFDVFAREVEALHQKELEEVKQRVILALSKAEDWEG